MKKLKILFVAAVALSLPHLAPHAEAKPRIIVRPAKPRPGDIVTVTVKGAAEPVEGKFGNQTIYFNPSKESFKAVFGVDLYTHPGTYKLTVSSHGRILSRRVTVARKKYPVQRLTLPKDMVELSPENEARVEREQKKLSALWPKETERLWNGSFMNPREGEISTRFGLRRIINGTPKSSHSGIDVSAEAGQKVYSPNNGVVALVDNQFFSGNSLILNHGQGIYTMFFHLSKVLVEEGQQVKKGQAIALVGSTGRSTGAHLHWGVRMQGARVDPLALIKLKLE